MRNYGKIGCIGKKEHRTYWSAAREAKNLNKYNDKARANAYHCIICKKYHVGNTLKGKGHNGKGFTSEDN